MQYQTTAVSARNKWEDAFEAWSQPPGKTEQERCENTVKQVTRAIQAHPPLVSKNVKTFPQGSYRNRVNVRNDSDVDVCCFHSGVFYYGLPAGYDRDFFGITPASYTYAQYKNEVETALVAWFGRRHVIRGKKAIDVNENTTRVDADVVAAFAYRQYFIGAFGDHSWHAGIALLTDRDNKLIANFPQQQYDNGVAKNDATGRRYKKQVRIQKALRNLMEEQDVTVADPITSFLIESWCWNAPEHCFNSGTLFADFEAVVNWVYENTANMKEVNGIKSLFSDANPWTEGDVRAFLQAAWNITH